MTLDHVSTPKREKCDYCDGEGVIEGETQLRGVTEYEPCPNCEGEGTWPVPPTMADVEAKRQEIANHYLYAKAYIRDERWKRAYGVVERIGHLEAEADRMELEVLRAERNA